MMIERGNIDSIIGALSRLLVKPMPLEDAYHIMLMTKEFKSLQDMFRTICILQKKELTGIEVLSLEPIYVNVEMSTEDANILEGIVYIGENAMVSTA